MLINNLQNSNKKLTEQELYYREIFNSTVNAIFIYSMDGKLLDINKRTLKMYGYTKSEILNIDIVKLSNLSKEKALEKRKKYLQEVADKGKATFDWQAKRKDGTL